MQLGHLLTRSGLTYPEVSSKVYPISFCQSDSSVSLPWVIYFEAFYLHVVSSFYCIPVICPKLLLFLTPLQSVHLFCNLSKCILLLFSCISSLLLLFSCRPLLHHATNCIIFWSYFFCKFYVAIFVSPITMNLFCYLGDWGGRTLRSAIVCLRDVVRHSIAHWTLSAKWASSF